MKYLVKAGLYRAFSFLPWGENWSYHFQRKVTRSLPCSDGVFRRQVEVAGRHFEVFSRHLPSVSPASARFYEFGAGWDLIVPLTFFCLGVGHQTIVDIRRNLRLELVDDTLSRLEAHRAEFELAWGEKWCAIPGAINCVSELFDTSGIRWLAPVDAKDTGLPSGDFDFVSNTATLEHIPEQDIVGALRECHRLLRPGGLISCLVDLKDHYAYFDHGISHYNFLSFSPHVWALLNSPLHFQNRLRYPDYLRLMKQSGFEIVDHEPERPSDADIEILKSLHLAEVFRNKYRLEDLGVKSLWVTLRKGTESAANSRNARATVSTPHSADSP